MYVYYTTLEGCKKYMYIYTYLYVYIRMYMYTYMYTYKFINTCICNTSVDREKRTGSRPADQ